MTSTMRINLLVASAAGLLWMFSFAINSWLLDFARHTPGIHLVFLPSGVRLLALLVGGFWAAAGITLGAFICMVVEFGPVSLHRIGIVSLATGFGAYLVLLAICRMAGLTPSLENLRPPHLPLIALGVAIGSSAVLNALYAAFGQEQWPNYVEHVAGMAAGDVLGSLAVIVLVMGALRLWRMAGKAA